MSVIEDEMIITEAFVPSGTELPVVSQGLFTGDDSLIKQWVAEGTWCGPDLVSLCKRQVREVTKEDLKKLQGAKEKLRHAQAVIDGAK
jgi:hypothetical protein